MSHVKQEDVSRECAQEPNSDEVVLFNFAKFSCRFFCALYLNIHSLEYWVSKTIEVKSQNEAGWTKSTKNLNYETMEMDSNSLKNTRLWGLWYSWKVTNYDKQP